jgi:ankyrin repeat protein
MFWVCTCNVIPLKNYFVYLKELLMGLPSEELSLDAVDQQNNTALHLACLKGHEESALIILNKCPEALLLKSNSTKKTALHIAAKSGLVRVVKELIKHGTDLHAIDTEGNIPALCCAPNAPVAACLELILNAMLELNLKDVSL